MTDTPASGGHRPVRRAALAFIFITVMLDILAIGVIIPVLPHLIQSFLGGDIGEAAHWVGIFGTCFALAQWLFSPLQGALSDHFGRRPVILLSNLGLGVASVGVDIRYLYQLTEAVKGDDSRVNHLLFMAGVFF